MRQNKIINGHCQFIMLVSFHMKFPMHIHCDLIFGISSNNNCSNDLGNNQYPSDHPTNYANRESNNIENPGNSGVVPR